MRSYEVLREAADKVGVKALAAEMRLSPAMIYKWCEDASPEESDASGARNPLDRVSKIFEITGHLPVISWLCQEAGGYFVENPTVQPERMGGELLLVTQELVQDFSRLLDEVSRSADDAQVTAGEAERIRASWERLKSNVETFVAACERGMYMGPQRKR